MALGQTDAGRYLTVLFIHKKTKGALILSARDMADKERGCIAENDSKELPSFASLAELVEFFEVTDMGEYDESLPKVDFDVVDLRRKTHLVAIDEETSNRLTEIAEQEQTPAESLVNS